MGEIKIGKNEPHFTLVDTNLEKVSLARALDNRVIFISRHNRSTKERIFQMVRYLRYDRK